MGGGSSKKRKQRALDLFAEMARAHDAVREKHNEFTERMFEDLLNASVIVAQNREKAARRRALENHRIVVKKVATPNWRRSRRIEVLRDMLARAEREHGDDALQPGFEAADVSALRWAIELGQAEVDRHRVLGKLNPDDLLLLRSTLEHKK